jgi:hypothetical protein
MPDNGFLSICFEKVETRGLMALVSGHGRANFPKPPSKRGSILISYWLKIHP